MSIQMDRPSTHRLLDRSESRFQTTRWKALLALHRHCQGNAGAVENRAKEKPLDSDKAEGLRKERVTPEKRLLRPGQEPERWALPPAPVEYNRFLLRGEAQKFYGCCVEIRLMAKSSNNSTRTMPAVFLCLNAQS